MNIVTEVWSFIDGVKHDVPIINIITLSQKLAVTLK
jgi:hypothetical protein